MEGNSYTEPSGIATALVDHFQNILGPDINSQHLDLCHVTLMVILLKRMQ